MTTLRRTAGAWARRWGLRRSRRPVRPSPDDEGGTRAPAGSPGPAIAWSSPPDGGSLDVRLGVFRDLIGLFPPGRLLDLGCGHGSFSVAALEMGWRVTAVDARTDRMPMTPGVDWVQHDVRDYDVAGFDAIALLGLLYHLELPDQVDLLRRCSGTATILDTHHSNRPKVVEGGYAGHVFHELPEDQADRLAATPTAAWGNMTAFWATQPDLVRMLSDAGFGRILAMVPPSRPNRTFYLCLPRRPTLGDVSSGSA